MLIVGLGGFLGSASRFWTQQYFLKILPWTFPVGTFIINVSGCLIIGIVYGLAERGNLNPIPWRLFLASGFCGGFTTFSAFSYEIMELLREHQYGYVLLYIGLSVMLGLIATYAGMVIAKGSLYI